MVTYRYSCAGMSQLSGWQVNGLSGVGALVETAAAGGGFPLPASLPDAAAVAKAGVEAEEGEEGGAEAGEGARWVGELEGMTQCKGMLEL